MPIIVEMPRMSDTMEEGTLIKWHVSVGDEVNSGDVLADIETDKATQELQAWEDGTIAKLVVDEGSTLAVGKPLLVLTEEGESVEDAAASAGASSGASSGGTSEKKAAASGNGADTSESSGGGTAVAEAPATTEAPPAPAGGKLRVSPVARKIADEAGLDLNGLSGSGPSGRIIKRDVVQAIESGGQTGGSPSAPEATGQAIAAPAVDAIKLEAKTIPVNNMRKTIAKRLVESKTTIPHFTVTVGVNIDPMMSLRQTINAQLESQGIKISVNDFIVRGTALALVQHPIVNSSWTGDGIEIKGTVNIGVAVALPEEKGGGLVVPTLRDSQNMGLRQISSETKRLAKKSREQGLTIDEMSDGTFTISNLGMFGVEHFEAIINPPQAAILAIGAGVQKPVVRDGEVSIGTEMSLTLSGDHRVIDGATGAIFLQTLKSLLENPASMLV